MVKEGWETAGTGPVSEGKEPQPGVGMKMFHGQWRLGSTDQLTKIFWIDPRYFALVLVLILITQLLPLTTTGHCTHSQ